MDVGNVDVREVFKVEKSHAQNGDGLIKGGQRAFGEVMRGYVGTDPEAVGVAEKKIDSDKDLRDRVSGRQGRLLNFMRQECQQNGLENPVFNDAQRAEVLWSAYIIETSGKAYADRVKGVCEKVLAGDPEKIELVSNRMISEFEKTQIDLIRYMARKSLVVEAGKTDGGLAKQIDLEAVQRWGTLGKEWVKAESSGDPTRERIGILHGIGEEHAAIISKKRYAHEQGYYYYFPKPNNAEAAKRNFQEIAGVNDAQDRFLQDVQALGAENFLNLPTGKLRDKFNDLDVIGREAKIHLMPNQVDEPMAVDRLFRLLEAKPELRDIIQAIKVRARGNGQADGFPEVVIYSTDKHANRILAELQVGMGDIHGSGITPRFNQEIANGFVYLAESGGDLKQNLAQAGVLDKVFDKRSNYARLRV